ncbi:hypothetical protein D0A34_10470 [Microcoleus vaginatus PCC 9802]|nr:hypothetical protein D0A34_10470 [Microcoleus vaginatus PCC 9802]
MRDRSYLSIGSEPITALDNQKTTTPYLSFFSSSVPSAPLRLKNKSSSQMKELNLFTPPNCQIKLD